MEELGAGPPENPPLQALLGTTTGLQPPGGGVSVRRRLQHLGVPRCHTREVGSIQYPRRHVLCLPTPHSTQAPSTAGASPPRTPVPSGPPLSGVPGLLRGTDGEGAEAVGTSVPVPPSFFLTLQSAGRWVHGRRVVGGSGAGPGSPEISGASPFGRPPARHQQGRAAGEGKGRSQPAWRWLGWGSSFQFRGCVTRRGGAGVKVRPQVCGCGVVARGAAIFGHFGAGRAPPIAREAAAWAAPSPPAAGPESPAGRGAEVMDWGRRARS